jgi:predicted PurR-regulated permease PerM
MAEEIETTARADAAALRQRVVDIAIQLGVLALFVYWSLKLIAPFIAIFIWAVILAVALYPAYAWLRRRLGGRGWLAATLITLAGIAIVLGPTATLAVSLAESLGSLAAGLRDGTITVPPPPDGVDDWPVIGERIHATWALASTNLESLLQSHGSKLLPAGSVALGKIAGVGFDVLMFAASVLVAGFLFGPGPRCAEYLHRFARRLTADRGDEFADLAGATIRNVSRGVIGIALLQAVLAGIVLGLFGVPGAGLIAFGVLLLCIVQIGPAPVLIPTIVWAWTAMDVGAAAGFTAAMVPIMLIDNVLKPVLMGRGLATPMLVIYIGVIGGTLSYGLIGLFLGPIALAVFYELAVAWIRAEPEPAKPVES